MQYKKITPSIHLLLDPMDRKRLSVECVYSSGGSWFEKPEDRGKKHLMEHCIASRTKALDFQAFKDYQFEKGFRVNAYTDVLSMGVEASGYYQDFELIFDTVFEMFTQPTFDEDIFKKEREIVLREASQYLGEPNYILFFDRMRRTFTPDSYSVHDVIGNPKKIASSQLADLPRLHQENLRNSHLVLGISGGGINQKYVEEKIEKLLTNQKSIEVKSIVDEKSKHIINFHPTDAFLDFDRLAFSHKFGHAHCDLVVYLPCPVNFKNAPVRKIFHNLFLAYNGVLYDRLRDDLQMVYSMSGLFDRVPEVIEINLTCELKYVNKIIEEIEKVFSNFKKYFNIKRFEESKNLVKKQQDISSDKLGSNVNFSAAGMMKFGEFEDYQSFSKRLEKVTKQDIQELYDQIQKKLPNKKVVAVSKDKKVEKIFN